MDPVWIGIAFILGFFARQVGLPPLVGFLGAGFVLHAMGVEAGNAIERISEYGITLLLFSIGLKLNLRSLLKPEIWGATTAHMAITVAVLFAIVSAVSATSVPVFAGLMLPQALLIAFALSFSSTVFAVKVFEERGELGSLHGRVSIGVLVMQDVIAVVFLAASTGKIPSPWALALLLLLPLRKPLMKLMDRSGHGELLTLYGFFLALGGAVMFDLVGMKGDLGALIIGALVAPHAKAEELAKSLLGFKELFLVGFFLSIGLSGTPTLEAAGAAVLLAIAVPFKAFLFFLLFSRFRLRVRTSLLSSLSLANYSEFGLIVGALAASNGWLDRQWLVIMAISLSLTFVVASLFNSASHRIYTRFHRELIRFQSAKRLPGDEAVDPGDAEIIVFGMGRVGAGAYDAMRQRFGEKVLGLDFNQAVVEKQKNSGRHVLLADATDPDFWEKCRPGSGRVRLVMLAMASVKENVFAARQLRDRGYQGRIAGIARYQDEIDALTEAGVDAAYNFYAEAGTGFAAHLCDYLGHCDIQKPLRA